jgi:hypothetical protein
MSVSRSETNCLTTGDCLVVDCDAFLASRAREVPQIHYHMASRNRGRELGRNLHISGALCFNKRASKFGQIIGPERPNPCSREPSGYSLKKSS